MHWSLFARMQMTVILLQVWTRAHTHTVDTLCIKAYTSSQLFKRESDLSICMLWFDWLFFQILDLNALLFALFSVNMKMCWQHTLQCPYIGLPMNLVGICCSNQHLAHLTIRSDDLQTACSSSTMWPTCITPAAYQTFMCPEILKPFESSYSNDEMGVF